MGRVKLEIKKIENIQSRHITYAKRRNGLIKKAYELSVLCDIDMALIMFSPSGKLSDFACKKTKIEDVIARFASLPEHERAKCQAPKRQDNQDIPLSTRIENHELLLNAVKKLNLESDIASHPGSISSANIENTRMEIRKIEMQSQATEERLRIYEMDPKCLDSVYKAQRLEQLVEHTLKRVQMRKQALLENNPLVAFSSAQMQLYAMQAQAGSLGGYQAAQQFIPWLLLKEPQTTIQNLIDHANSGAILTARDAHGTLEYSSNASLYSGLMAQGADLQLTTQSNQPHVWALTHLKSEGFYPFERSMMHGKDMDLPGYASPKVEEDQVRQEMVGAYASNDVLSSAFVLQSAYQNATISIASPSSNQLPLGQQVMLGNVQNSMMSQSDTMQHFEGNMPTSHVESSHNEQAHSHGLLSLGCSFNN